MKSFAFAEGFLETARVLLNFLKLSLRAWSHNLVQS